MNRNHRYQVQVVYPNYVQPVHSGDDRKEIVRWAKAKAGTISLTVQVEDMQENSTLYNSLRDGR